MPVWGQKPAASRAEREDLQLGRTKTVFCANFDPHAYRPPIATARRGPSFAELYRPWFSRGPYTDKNPFSAIADTEQTLQEVFNRNILPGKYRNLSATAFIASFMGASNYDLKFAIERYDKEIDQVIAREIKKGQAKLVALAATQKELMESTLSELQYANYLNSQVTELLANGNDILRSTRNWTAVNAILKANDITCQRKKEPSFEDLLSAHFS